MFDINRNFRTALYIVTQITNIFVVR